MTSENAKEFETHRQKLVGIAYRMLGSVVEAQDIVQEAYLRWHGMNLDQVQSPGAFLSKVVTRLCLDHIKAARHKRELYVGTWLPEPIIGQSGDVPKVVSNSLPTEPVLDPRATENLPSDISMALMLALERLSPLERAAFILHDIFDMDFKEIAKSLERSPAACRQLASRARVRIRENRPKLPTSDEKAWSLTQAFLFASRSGDVSGLQAILSSDVVLVSDGGGRKPATLRPLIGQERVCRLFNGLFRRIKSDNGIMPRWHMWATINSLPGFITIEYDGTLQTTGLEMHEDQVKTIYITRNPDKLTHVLRWIPS
ncbi:MAG: sigma-70 family RNA polymerase sigma factor [Myxococcales bacterium]|nr:sigma-70 family RNA polymerase sigma factor [Myxococcales bacterium]